MQSLRGSIFAAAILMSSSLHADVTIRYQTDFKPVGSPRAGATDPTANVPGRDFSFSIRMKGNKGRVNSDGSTLIVDFVKLELTLLDTSHRQYAVIPTAEYAGKVASAIAGMGGPGLNVLGAMKTKVEGTSTGRSELIHGVQAEERQITFTMQPPEPAAASPFDDAGVFDGLTRVPSDSSMKIVMQIWTAKPGEALRLPAIRELAGFNLWQKLFLDPLEMLGPLAPKSSDTGNAMEKLFAEIGINKSVLLRMHMEMFMPSMGALAAQTSGQPAAAPFMQMTQEVADISTAPVDDTEFLVPADYTAAPFEQVLAATFSARTGAQSEAVSAPGRLPEFALDGPPDAPPPLVDVQAYVPLLTPVHRVEPDLARAKGVQGMVELLVTLDPQGNVTQAEALTGPEVLRKQAIDTVMQWTFRPVIRGRAVPPVTRGVPVPAYTTANVDFIDWSKGPGGSMSPVDETMAAMERLSRIEKSMPRSPQQVLADLEQDAGGGDAMRRYYALDPMAQAALKAGDEVKAAAYANELLQGRQPDATDWNYGNAMHDGHMVLGLIAVRHGDIPAARQQLLEAGKTPGSPQLDSFGPNMMLAKELVEKGERDAVLEYFSECRSFWKMGAGSLDAWSETVKKGATPVFGGNLR